MSPRASPDFKAGKQMAALTSRGVAKMVCPSVIQRFLITRSQLRFGRKESLLRVNIAKAEPGRFIRVIGEGRIIFRSGLAAALVLSIASSGTVYAQATDVGAVQAAQGKANSKPGARSVPARVIPIPAGLKADEAALVGAPYWPFWNIDPPNRAAWRKIIAQAAKAELPLLAKARTALGSQFS